MDLAPLGELRFLGEVIITTGETIGGAFALNDAKLNYLPRGAYGYYSQKNSRVFQRFVASIIRLTSVFIYAVKTAVSWILTSLQKVAALVHLQFLGVIGGVLSLTSSVMDSFRLITRLHSLKESIDNQLSHARSQRNSKMEREILTYKMVKSVEIVSKFFSMALTIVSLLSIVPGCVVTAPALITMLAISMIIFVASLIMHHTLKIDEIEKKYFPDEPETKIQTKK